MGARLAIKKDIEEHFLSKACESANGCLEWLGCKNRHGYGVIGLNGDRFMAHRLAWMLFRSEIPAGMFICHHCDNPSCVNPEHLFIGTPKDNTQDARKKGRLAYGKRNQWAKLTPEKIKEAYAMNRNGASCHYIAKHFGVSRNTITRALSGSSWSHEPLPFLREKPLIYRQNINADEIEEIFRLRRLGLTKAEIARRINRSFSTVSGTVDGQRNAKLTTQFREVA
jgi:hypothetical protein